MAMQDLKQRTFLFAVAVGKLVNNLPYNAVNREYFTRLLEVLLQWGQITGRPGALSLMQIF